MSRKSKRSNGSKLILLCLAIIIAIVFIYFKNTEQTTYDLCGVEIPAALTAPHIAVAPQFAAHDGLVLADCRRYRCL